MVGTGGNGGEGLEGASGGRGGDVLLRDTVTGSGLGSLGLYQQAIGGTGGGASGGGDGGAGGRAESVLAFNGRQAAPDAAASATLSGYGGSGGRGRASVLRAAAGQSPN